MDATLIISHLTQAYSDTPLTAAPIMKSADWASQLSVAVSNAKSDPYKIAPGATLSVFSGSESTGIDGTTQFTLALSTLASNRYRFTATSGTSPAFRTDRGLTLATRSVTIAVNVNQTATFTSTSGSFSAVQPGDSIFIPGPTTGDTAGPFNAQNEGLWTVLSVAGDGTSVQVTRPSSATFSAFAEAQTVVSNGQLTAFSTAGVQVGDSVSISAGFTGAVLSSFTIAAVTPKWFEIVTTAALPVAAVATPGASGMTFYTMAKRYVRILADQQCIPRLNGDSGSTNTMSPWLAGDMKQMAEFVKVGPTWALSITNVSQSTMNVLVISAE